MLHPGSSAGKLEERSSLENLQPPVKHAIRSSGRGSGYWSVSSTVFTVLL